ncbi:transporter [Pengzhenrongella phosphoraccumulans]|uniref:GntT/GntP/DsdX family permease n=1 Tax=Pengzhenrongella phosphoraccumulans TaxID=3114394 RepID=UPI00388D57D5
MGTAALLTIALVAVAILLVLVIKFELSAFVALLLVSMGTALVAGIPVIEVVPVMVAGMGKVLGSVAIVVGLGSMLGRLIEVSGGAENLARRFTGVLGPKRVIAALTAAAFILGIPVFFDVAFIILAPIVFAFAKVAKLNPMKIGLPVAGVLLTVHVALPPHPGPVAASVLTGADVGLMTLVGLVVCALVGVIGFFAAKLFRVEGITLLPSPASESLGEDDGMGHPSHADDSDLSSAVPSGSGRSDSGLSDATRSGGGVLTATRFKARTNVPSATMVTTLILVPIVMIMAGSVSATVLEEGSAARSIATFLGAPTTALLAGLMVAYFLIGSKTGWSRGKRTSVLDSALPMVAVIIFVTGAGGVFGNVLVETGIGAALSSTLQAAGLPLILSGFLITLALRAAQGSATVAILTSAGLLSEAITGGGYSSIQVVVLTLAICFGGLGLSHINDSGFWIVTKYLGLSVADGLKTWTVLTTILSISGFLITCLLWAMV